MLVPGRRNSKPTPETPQLSYFAKANIPEHHPTEAIVQLQANRPSLRSLRIARMFRRYLAIHSNANHVVTRLDVQHVPVVHMLHALLCRDKKIDAAGLVLVAVGIANLDFIADMPGLALAP